MINSSPVSTLASCMVSQRKIARAAIAADRIEGGDTSMRSHIRFWLHSLAIIAMGAIVSPAMAADRDLDDLPVGTVQNFGPNLQTAAGGICRQPEGIAIDPDGNLYAASNSDAAT